MGLRAGDIPDNWPGVKGETGWAGPTIARGEIP